MLAWWFLTDFIASLPDSQAHTSPQPSHFSQLLSGSGQRPCVMKDPSHQSCDTPPLPPPQKWITSEVLNQAKSIFWSSEEWKGRDRELKQGQALALALEAQRHKSAFSWVTGEAQGMQHGSSELEANPNKGRSSLLLDSLLRNCSYRRGTNKIFCKIPLPMLLCLFYFFFFQIVRKIQNVLLGEKRTWTM